MTIEKHLAPTWELHRFDGLKCACKPDHIDVALETDTDRAAMHAKYPETIGATLVVVHKPFAPNPNSRMRQ